MEELSLSSRWTTGEENLNLELTRAKPDLFLTDDPGESLVVRNVALAAMDNSHCPGSLMFILCLASGETILHTGDFRARPLMEEYSQFWSDRIPP